MENIPRNNCNHNNKVKKIDSKMDKFRYFHCVLLLLLFVLMRVYLVFPLINTQTGNESLFYQLIFHFNNPTFNFVQPTEFLIAFFLVLEISFDSFWYILVQTVSVLEISFDSFWYILVQTKMNQMKFLKLRYKNAIKNSVGWTKLKVGLLK